MPKYVYECKKHGLVDQWGKFSDAPTQPCPKCGKEMKRVFQPYALIVN